MRIAPYVEEDSGWPISRFHPENDDRVGVEHAQCALSFLRRVVLDQKKKQSSEDGGGGQMVGISSLSFIHILLVGIS